MVMLVSAAMIQAITHVQRNPHLAVAESIALEGQACFNMAEALPLLTTLTGAKLMLLLWNLQITNCDIFLSCCVESLQISFLIVLSINLPLPVNRFITFQDSMEHLFYQKTASGY